MKKICLCMIVKDEAHIIRRSLESVKGFIDYWVITDTGSSDATKEIVIEVMKGIPGQLVDVPWQNFGFNRTESLRLAKDVSDYSLILDADEFMVFEEGFDKARFKDSLNLDLYDVVFKMGNVTFTRAVLTKNSLNWLYKGIIHEFPESLIPVTTRGAAAGFHQMTLSDGSRSQDPKKFGKDAKVLESALLTETDSFMRARYTFYLAQSYRDSGELRQSYLNYLKRSTQGGWEEEVFLSLLGAGKIAVQLGKPQEEILSLFSRAFCAAPWRSESIYSAVFYLRGAGQYGLGYLLAKAALDIPNPGLKSLFVNNSVYDYALLDEYAVCAFYSKKFEECRSACVALLKSGKLPGSDAARVENNIKLCENKS